MPGWNRFVGGMRLFSHKSLHGFKTGWKWEHDGIKVLIWLCGQQLLSRSLYPLFLSCIYLKFRKYSCHFCSNGSFFNLKDKSYFEDLWISRRIYSNFAKGTQDYYCSLTVYTLMYFIREICSQYFTVIHRDLPRSSATYLLSGGCKAREKSCPDQVNTDQFCPWYCFNWNGYIFL